MSKKRLKKCLFCKRKESRRLIGSVMEGVCSWCYTKHPPGRLMYNDETGECKIWDNKTNKWK